jgi:hypothetical protein
MVVPVGPIVAFAERPEFSEKFRSDCFLSLFRWGDIVKCTEERSNGGEQSYPVLEVKGT